MPVTSAGVERHRFDIGLEDLQTFLAVAELGSFSRAAEHLNLSQPSVSNRVRRLEEKVFVRLLRRTSRHVELTEPGRLLYAEAADTLRGLRDLLQSFNQDASSRKRQVKIAATMMIATTGLPAVLRKFQDANPAVTLLLHDLSSAEAIEQVMRGDCDLAVMAAPEPLQGLSFEPLVSDTCVVVTPLGHKLLQQSHASLADVLEYPLLSPNWQTGIRQIVLETALQRGLTVRFSTEARNVGNILTLLAMAAAGIGVCIHPRSFVPTELAPSVGVVPLADCEIIRTFGILTADARPLSPSADRFCAFVRDLAAAGPTGGIASAIQ